MENKKVIELVVDSKVVAILFADSGIKVAGDDDEMVDIVEYIQSTLESNMDYDDVTYSHNVEFHSVETNEISLKTDDGEIKIKDLYNDLVEFRNRLSSDSSLDVYEEDILLLDHVLDVIEKEYREE